MRDKQTPLSHKEGSSDPGSVTNSCVAQESHTPSLDLPLWAWKGGKCWAHSKSSAEACPNPKNSPAAWAPGRVLKRWGRGEKLGLSDTQALTVRTCQYRPGRPCQSLQSWVLVQILGYLTMKMAATPLTTHREGGSFHVLWASALLHFAFMASL